MFAAHLRVGMDFSFRRFAYPVGWTSSAASVLIHVETMLPFVL
jgi:hypothetical protein